MYAHWVCAARETPIFSPKFPFQSISFSQMTKKSGPEHYNFNFFCRSGDHHFQNFFNFNPVHRLPRRAGSARTQSVRQRPGLVAGQSASQSHPGSSGDPHFHARPWSSVRSPVSSEIYAVAKFMTSAKFMTLTLSLTLIYDPNPNPNPILAKYLTSKYFTHAQIAQ